MVEARAVKMKPSRSFYIRVYNFAYNLFPLFILVLLFVLFCHPNRINANEELNGVVVLLFSAVCK